ncbi:alpha/beta fold hydrolase [Caulobacter sp. KR2-114]|uniref:alpha/beta fold hydrolase n=1 Tax=Caulobacter sp. KR2-114 TaxID=3400912 RepID=UPI003C060FFD
MRGLSCLVMALLAALSLAACAPTLQHAGRPDLTFQGPRLAGTEFVSFDGARLGVSRWDAEGEPWAVIVGVHGMNDYANAFHLAGPWWAKRGITTIAYDQRGFGRSPQRGIWAGDGLMTEDLRTLTALVRRQYPHAVIAVAGESLGGSVVIETMASDRPAAADRAVLIAPAVWGWSNLPLPYKSALWLADHLAPSKVFNPPGFVTQHISPSDNREELIAMGRDPLMVWGARSDTLYGLVSTMQHAWKETGQVKGPTLWLYGDHDQIIPKGATYQAAARLAPGNRSAFYAQGWHLLLVDRQAETVWGDIAAFLRDPNAPLPSGAPTIPGAPTAPNTAVRQAALPPGDLVAAPPAP